jgi:hypothetical protein
VTAPDTVFAYFVDANPVLDESIPGGAIPSLDPDNQTRVALTPPGPRVPRRGLLVAAAAFVAVMVTAVALVLFSLRSTDPQPADPEELLLNEAVVAIEDYFAAIEAGDVDAAMAHLAEHERTVVNRTVHEWRSAVAAAGMPQTIKACDLEAVSMTRVEGRCTLLLNDPVADELGAGEQVARFTYESGLLTESAFEGESIGKVNASYSEYVRTFHEDEYNAVCQPGAYEPGTFVQSELLALTGECATFVAPLADDVVAWLRAGRPRD